MGNSGLASLSWAHSAVRHARVQVALKGAFGVSVLAIHPTVRRSGTEANRDAAGIVRGATRRGSRCRVELDPAGPPAATLHPLPLPHPLARCRRWRAGCAPRLLRTSRRRRLAHRGARNQIADPHRQAQTLKISGGGSLGSSPQTRLQAAQSLRAFCSVAAC